MKTIITIFIIFSFFNCFSQQTSTLAKAIDKNPPDKGSVTLSGSSQQAKSLQSTDTILVLNQWHVQQIAAFDAEIKRLGGTTIEAEQQRISAEKQILINSFIAGKVYDLSRIETLNQPIEGRIVLRLKPKK